MNNFLIDEGDIDISIVPKNLSIEQFSIYLDEIRNNILRKNYVNKIIYIYYQDILYFFIMGIFIKYWLEKTLLMMFLNNF